MRKLPASADALTGMALATLTPTLLFHSCYQLSQSTNYGKKKKKTTLEKPFIRPNVLTPKGSRRVSYSWLPKLNSLLI
jgi:hypothetical protein